MPPAAAAPCVVGGRVAGTGGSGGGDLEAALAAAAAHAARLVGATYDRASAETPRTSNSGTGTETCTDPLEQPINMGHVVGLSSHSSPLSPYQCVHACMRACCWGVAGFVVPSRHFFCLYFFPPVFVFGFGFFVQRKAHFQRRNPRAAASK